MSKFIHNNERHGTCYLEFQFCATDEPLKDGKAVPDTEFWKDNSLFIHGDDFNEFYELYGDVFGCAVFPNGKTGLDVWGINYYGKEETEKIIKEFSLHIKEEYAALLPWLKAAEKHGKGFYILGV